MTLSPQAHDKQIKVWLFACAFMVFAMVIIGAITRLTESGLSMVEWRPLIGSLPPLSEAEWTRVFQLYQDTPEFQKKNSWMSVEEFKTIFFWEWFHRFWGRIIGLIYALPLVWFWVKGHLPAQDKWKYIGLLLLGGAQGFMGWYMVKSGLVDQPAVSHYRLAAHLCLAFLLFSLLIWMGLSQGNQTSTKDQNTSLITHLWTVIGCLIITIFWGAYTAGLDGGLIYNDSFPLMGNALLPDEIQQYDPNWIGLFESPAGVQFMHRWLAIGTIIMIASFWFHGLKKRPAAMPYIHMFMAMGSAQIAIGLITLISVVWLPVALMHQAGALILLMLSILNLHHLSYSREAGP